MRNQAPDRGMSVREIAQTIGDTIYNGKHIDESLLDQEPLWIIAQAIAKLQAPKVDVEAVIKGFEEKLPQKIYQIYQFGGLDTNGQVGFEKLSPYGKERLKRCEKIAKFFISYLRSALQPKP